MPHAQSLTNDLLLFNFDWRESPVATSTTVASSVVGENLSFSVKSFIFRISRFSTLV